MLMQLYASSQIPYIIPLRNAFGTCFKLGSLQEVNYSEGFTKKMGGTYKYRITLLVTLEEENAIVDLYLQKRWQYIKLSDDFLPHMNSVDNQCTSSEICNHKSGNSNGSISDTHDEPETQFQHQPDEVSRQKNSNKLHRPDSIEKEDVVKAENLSDETIKYDASDFQQEDYLLSEDMSPTKETDVMVKFEHDDNEGHCSTEQTFKESIQNVSKAPGTFLQNSDKKRNRAAAPQPSSTVNRKSRKTTVADLLKLKRDEARNTINVASENDDVRNRGQSVSSSVKERIETMLKNSNDLKEYVTVEEKHVKKGQDHAFKELLDKQINKASLIIQEEGKSDCVCCICDKTFDTIDLFKAHAKPCLKLLTCKREGTYTCRTCGSCFDQAFSLLGHRLSQICKPGIVLRDGKDYVCKHCGVKYKSRRKSEFVLHLLAHTNLAAHACTFCGKSFVRWTVLRNHLRSHTGERPFVCRSCPKNFRSFMGRRCHELTKHTEHTKSFMCEICGASFPLKIGLGSHLRVVHTEKRYKCDICGKELKSQISVNKHKKIHANIRSHICEICGKGFLLPSNLNLHMKRHRNERSHFCEVCKKGFYNKQNLIIHMRVHSGDKPFSCPHCNYRCAVKGNLNKHVKSCHPNPE